MAAAKMNDEELRSKLAELGEDVGPITDSTRSLWQNKLDRLLSEQKTRRCKPSLSQYSSDTESDTKTSKSEPASKPDRPLPRSRRRTLNKSALSEAPRNTDAEFKKPTGTPKSWRTSRQELAPSSSYGTRSSLSRLVRPSLRSVSRVNGSADFESSDSDVDEVSSRSGRASKRASSSILHSTADSSRATSYVTTGVGPRTSTPLQTDTSPDSSELNTTATMWEGNTVDQSGDAVRLPSANTSKRGSRKQKGSIEPAKQAARSKASEQSPSSKRNPRVIIEPIAVKRQEESVQESKAREEPMEVETSSSALDFTQEFHHKSLQFIQLQIENAKKEHKLRMQMAEEEHELKMKQLSLMMKEIRKKLSLPVGM